MKPVRGDDGRHYLLVKRSDDASLVRDPKTGNECYIGNDRLEDVDDMTGLETAARAIPDRLRRVIRAAHDDRTLGLLVELADRGPLSVRTLLAETTYCESDLAGTLASLTASGVITEVETDGERGYETTEACERALSTLQNASTK